MSNIIYNIKYSIFKISFIKKRKIIINLSYNFWYFKYLCLKIKIKNLGIRHININRIKRIKNKKRSKVILNF